MCNRKISFSVLMFLVIFSILMAIILATFSSGAEAHSIALPDRPDGVIVIDTRAPLGSFDNPILIQWPYSIGLPKNLELDDGTQWTFITNVIGLRAYSEQVPSNVKPDNIFIPRIIFIIIQRTGNSIDYQ
jgi:hypothetical protein